MAVVGVVSLAYVGKVSVELTIGVLTALGVVVAAVITQVSSKQRDIEARQLEQRREIEARQFEQKRALYEEMIDIYRTVLLQGNKNLAQPKKRPSQQQLAAKLFDVRIKMMLWADRDIVEWWLGLDAMTGADNPVDALMHFDHLILLMRAELGKDNSGLEPGDMVSMLLTGGREELKKGLTAK